MEIDAYTLLLYFAIWTIFYFYLSHYIARLSRDKWVEYIRSEESDEMLVEALSAVIEDIEDRMHDKLEQFQSSFFGSLGAASKKVDEATGASSLKALTKENPMMGFVAEYLSKRAGIGPELLETARGEGQKQPTSSGKLGLK